MPIKKKWTLFNLLNILKVPKEPGAYELRGKNKKDEVDIGKGENLQRRLKQKRKIRKTATHFRYKKSGVFKTATELEAELSSKFQKKHGRKPKHTKRSPKIFNLFDFKI